MKPRALLYDEEDETTQIYLREYVGIVASDADTARFTFFITAPKGVSVRKGDYVIVDHPILGELCPLLAVVREIKTYERKVF